MEYLDALRRHGWVPDPGEPFEVVPRHAATCPVERGRPCCCTPRLELRPAAGAAQRGTSRRPPARATA